MTKQLLIFGLILAVALGCAHLISIAIRQQQTAAVVSYSVPPPSKRVTIFDEGRDRAYEYCMKNGPSSCLILSFGSYAINIMMHNDKDKTSGKTRLDFIDPHDPSETVLASDVFETHSMFHFASVQSIAQSYDERKLPAGTKKKIMNAVNKHAKVFSNPNDASLFIGDLIPGNKTPREGYWTNSCYPLTYMDKLTSNMRASGFTTESPGYPERLPDCSGIHSNLCSDVPYTADQTGLGREDYPSIACQVNNVPYAAANIEGTFYPIDSSKGQIPVPYDIAVHAASACAWSDAGDTKLPLSVTPEKGAIVSGNILTSFYLDKIDKNHLMQSVKGSSATIDLSKGNIPALLGVNPAKGFLSHQIFARVTEVSPGWLAPHTSEKPITVQIGKGSCVLIQLSTKNKEYGTSKPVILTVNASPDFVGPATAIEVYGYTGTDPKTSRFLGRFSLTGLPQAVNTNAKLIESYFGHDKPLKFYVKFAYPSGTPNAENIMSNEVTVNPFADNLPTSITLDKSCITVTNPLDQVPLTVNVTGSLPKSGVSVGLYNKSGKQITDNPQVGKKYTLSAVQVKTAMDGAVSGELNVTAKVYVGKDIVGTSPAVKITVPCKDATPKPPSPPPPKVVLPFEKRCDAAAAKSTNGAGFVKVPEGKMCSMQEKYNDGFYSATFTYGCVDFEDTGAVAKVGPSVSDVANKCMNNCLNGSCPLIYTESRDGVGPFCHYTTGLWPYNPLVGQRNCD